MGRRFGCAQARRVRAPLNPKEPEPYGILDKSARLRTSVSAAQSRAETTGLKIFPPSCAGSDRRAFNPQFALPRPVEKLPAQRPTEKLLLQVL